MPGTLWAVASHNIVIGYLLWAVFGLLGVHRFYFGKRKTGILYFLTFGVAGVGWIIDLFLVPRMKRQIARRYQVGPFSYSVAWLLLMLLGVLGAHRFYLRHWGVAILYLLTGGLLGLGVLYDIFVLNDVLSESNEAWISDAPQVRGGRVG